MRRTCAVVLAAGALPLLLAACVPHHHPHPGPAGYPPEADYAADAPDEPAFAPGAPPPPPGAARLPESPGTGYVWIPGRWVWVRASGQWHWREGQWVLPPHPDARWVDGHWERRPRGWLWVPGRWIIR